MASFLPHKVAILSRDRATSDASTLSLDSSWSAWSDTSVFSDEPMRVELPGYDFWNWQEYRNDEVDAEDTLTAGQCNKIDHAVRLQTENQRLEQENALLLMQYSSCLLLLQQGLLGGVGVQSLQTPQIGSMPSCHEKPSLRNSETRVAAADTRHFTCTEHLAGRPPPGAQPRTSAMLRNLPISYSRQLLLDLFDGEGFAGKYDFVYLPIDFKTNVNLGYCFINLINDTEAARFWQHFEGFSNWAIPSKKVASLNWCESQGLQPHIGRYQNSSIMQDDVPDEFKPVLFSNGQRVPFPTTVAKSKVQSPKYRWANARRGKC